MRPSAAPPVSNFANPSHPQQNGEEAPTPTISNRGSPSYLPPPLSLDGAPAPPSLSLQNSEHSTSCTSLSSQEARFSSLTAEPIELERPLLEDTPVCFSPRMATVQEFGSPTKRVTPTMMARQRQISSPIQRSPRQQSSMASPIASQNFPLAWGIHESTMESTASTAVGSGGSEGEFWISLFLQVMPYSVACDIIKTGVPWTLLRNLIITLWQRTILSSSGKVLGSRQRLRMETPLLTNRQASSPREGSIASAGSCSRGVVGSPFSNAPSLRQGVVQGIQNFGQTCFMNSVLQSLASLEPFLAYLERLERIHHDTQTMGTTTTTKNLLPSPLDSFARQVLDVLMAANGLEAETAAASIDNTCKRTFVSRAQRGNHNRLKIDPRPLLRRIGETHSQFQRKHMGEQQDAQEWLQALLGVVISEASLDSITAASDHMRFEDDEENYGSAGDDGPLTAVMAGVEGLALDVPLRSSTASSSSCSDGEPFNALSLSSLLERIDEGQRSMLLQSRRSSEDLLTTSSSSKSVESLSRNEAHPYPEEKKQEDFEISVPFVASELCLEKLTKQSPPPAHVIQLPKSNQCLSTSALSDTSWGEESRTSAASNNQSMAMKIVKSTISSITPSPLSGWLGSTIQCCNCQHVRPIRNSPFLDIPLVPTSVPAFLGGVHKQGPNSPHIPACTIEQCLADFTSVERVQDVECRYCTIQAEIRELQEEQMLLDGAIESTEKRIKAKGGDPLKETKSLHEELNQIQLRLFKLQTMDPDDEDLTITDPSTYGDESLLLDDPNFCRSTRLARCDARKCLFLTRCPSILCCHIQRRYYDPYSNRMEKCNQQVLFDEILNLAPYCAYSPEASTAWVAGSSRSSDLQRKEKRPMLYRLQSVIEHRGNAHGGHYVCYRRFGSSWYRISDNSVTAFSWKQVRNCQAYMLFYEAM